jgi:hypothetical protein
MSNLWAVITSFLGGFVDTRASDESAISAHLFALIIAQKEVRCLENSTGLLDKKTWMALLGVLWLLSKLAGR